MNRPGSGGYLIDTDVLSALAPERPAVPEAFGAWLRRNSEKLYIPCIAVAELEQGICKLRRAGGTGRAKRLAACLTGFSKATPSAS